MTTRGRTFGLAALTLTFFLGCFSGALVCSSLFGTASLNKSWFWASTLSIEGAVSGSRHFPEVANVTIRCEENPPKSKRELLWRPSDRRYLIAGCTYGLLTNRLNCFETSMIVAGLLNRTLVIPDEDLHSYRDPPYNYSVVFDAGHARSCLGESTVFMQKELTEKLNLSGGVLTIDRVHCFSIEWLCVVHAAKKWKSLAISENASVTYANITFPPHPSDIIQAYSGIEDEFLFLGDLFQLSYRKGKYLHKLRSMVPESLRGGKCEMVMKPHDAVIQTARGYVREFLGWNFAALHYRRGDFYKHLLREGGSRVWSTQQAAACVMDKLRSAHIQTLFLATDAQQEEVALLEKYLSMDASFPVVVMRLPSMKDWPWAESLDRLQLTEDGLAIAMVEKFVAALSRVFISSSGSTFSFHIHGLRSELGMPRCADEEICRDLEWKDVIPDRAKLFP